MSTRSGSSGRSRARPSATRCFWACLSVCSEPRPRKPRPAMSDQPSDQAARDRFTRDWGTNLAVVANAGSGKTTAIARRLAALALSREGSEGLRRTAVVTYTNKAAEQIRQSARRALLHDLSQSEGADMSPLSRL